MILPNGDHHKIQAMPLRGNLSRSQRLIHSGTPKQTAVMLQVPCQQDFSPRQQKSPTVLGFGCLLEVLSKKGVV